MLVIDDDMVKLAKMQERLLKATDSNREKNLENYKKTVIQIDSEAFDGLLKEIKKIETHNQTLEDELQFLEEIKSGYDQLRELQLGFISVCETYGANDLKLSNLSQLNIEYIDNRINTINGYLLNIRNIDINKKRLQELSEQLVVEEKKKDYINSKLEQLETELRESFIAAEGRILVDGSLQYTSVLNEYKNLEIDFDMILDDNQLLRKKLFDIDKEKSEVEEKYRAAEICYNNFPNSESKQILDEIRVDFLRVKYRFSMLKILELLSTTYVNYDLFREKREKLLDLIKYRQNCLESLGIKFSIDPFSRTKTSQQLGSLVSLPDNSKHINKIRKEISQLTERTEQMINQNNSYLVSLNDAKELLISNVGISDIDISSIQLQIEDNTQTDDMVSHRVIEDNQVTEVRHPINSLNMSIIGQKTQSVIKRVNQMINDASLSVSTEIREFDTVSPNLVIIPTNKQEEKQVFEDDPRVEYDDIFVDIDDDSVLDDEKVELESDEEILMEEEPVILEEENDIFETVVPFSEPVIFEERRDDPFGLEKVMPTEEATLEEDSDATKTEETQKDEPVLDSISGSLDETLAMPQEEIDEMPDAFWVTESDDKKEVVEEPEDVLSFDDQINILLSGQDNVKTRRLETDKNTRKVA